MPELGKGVATAPWWRQIDVSDWRELQIEPGGSMSVRWLENPETGDGWLHKYTTVPDTGIEQGEDWAEAIATQVAVMLGVPCALVSLCTRHGMRGSLSRDLRLRGYSFWPANVWLYGRATGYVPQKEGAPGVDPGRPGVRRPGHTLKNFCHALSETAVPPDFRGEATNGFDVLAGYFVLDALVANRDRHTENWAVLEPQVGSDPTMLAPSFDHGGSLGFNVKDEDRRRFLDESRVESWVRKGTAHRLEHTVGQRRPTLVEAAGTALALASPAARAWWRGQVDNLDLSSVLDVVREGRVAAMSDLARTFAIESLTLNLERLRHVLGTVD
ncbi:hypothetical protein OCAE111667_09175 [Occultella aeris]|uniref:HipA-like C-terminal domain-containing protein n=1 Tax=Occultella aeris TaxID=2761496 RepID=A0A7M4DJU6_9MICO|nr:hypothetical protein [Occultella aeris]VZO37331.1 hypothetical protein HALOF300_02404 [Occultella aeris]